MKHSNTTWSFEELMQLERIAHATAGRAIHDRLMAFIAFCKWNAVRFADHTELDISMFSRIKNGRMKRPELRTIIAICAGLRLPLHIIEELLHSAGLSLGNSKTGCAYRYVLSEMHGCTVYEANIFLHSQGVSLLGNLGVEVRCTA
jgi:DNA-binding Xre family transcriptional regulator